MHGIVFAARIALEPCGGAPYVNHSEHNLHWGTHSQEHCIGIICRYIFVLSKTHKIYGHPTWHSETHVNPPRQPYNESADA